MHRIYSAACSRASRARRGSRKRELRVASFPSSALPANFYDPVPPRRIPRHWRRRPPSCPFRRRVVFFRDESVARVQPERGECADCEPDLEAGRGRDDCLRAGTMSCDGVCEREKKCDAPRYDSKMVRSLTVFSFARATATGSDSASTFFSTFGEVGDGVGCAFSAGRTESRTARKSLLVLRPALSFGACAGGGCTGL